MNKQRPEHAPKGYEWLPDAYHRDIQPGGEQSLEAARQALAEGHIVALLRTDVGERHKIPERMWDKEAVHEKVFPRFEDGRMQIRTELWTGHYVEGWIFVKVGVFASLASQSGEGERVVSNLYESGNPGRPTSKHLILEEFKRRLTEGRASPNLAAEAAALREWLEGQHPFAPQTKEKTIKNNIRARHRTAFPTKSPKPAQN